jgi:hypothetical protein
LGSTLEDFEGADEDGVAGDGDGDGVGIFEVSCALEALSPTGTEGLR